MAHLNPDGAWLELNGAFVDAVRFLEMNYPHYPEDEPGPPLTSDPVEVAAWAEKRTRDVQQLRDLLYVLVEHVADVGSFANPDLHWDC